MQMFDRDMVEELLDMSGCIGAMRQVLADYSAGRTVQVLRTAMPFEPGKILGVMPAALPGLGLAGAKLLTVYPGNGRKGLPSHQGVVALFSSDDGRLAALCDAEAITGVRTAAASAAATDALARKDAHILCLMGTGLQARRHMEAMRLVRPIDKVRVWGRDRERTARFVREIADQYGIPVEDCCGDAEKAVSGADIVCTVTAATEPILFGRYLSPGTHVNAVGACGAVHRELDAEAVARARLFCDSRESCLSEAGDFLIPLKEGTISAGHLLGEVGRVFSGDLPGRLTDDDITLFESQGLAVEDLAAAHYVLQKALSGV